MNYPTGHVFHAVGWTKFVATRTPVSGQAYSQALPHPKRMNTSRFSTEQSSVGNDGRFSSARASAFTGQSRARQGAGPSPRRTRLALGALAPASGQPQTPTPERRVLAPAAQHVLRTLHQQAPQHRAAGFGNAQLRRPPLSTTVRGEARRGKFSSLPPGWRASSFHLSGLLSHTLASSLEAGSAGLGRRW